MTHSLSNRINSHAIVFTDRSHMYISENSYNALLGTTAEKVRINGMEYATKSISKLLTFKEFQNQYPEKVWNENESALPNYTYPNGLPKDEDNPKPKNSQNAIKGLIRGLDKFIAENETTGKAEAMREQLQQQLI